MGDTTDISGVSEDLLGLQEEQRSDYGAHRLFGVYIAVVTNLQDPENRARIKVKFPWLADSEESWWARVSTFYAGKGRGSYWIPEVDDEVLVVFEHGDFNHPYVVGSVWNGVDNVPGPGNPDGENNIKHIELRTGHKLIFDDTAGAEKITLIDCSGNNFIEIDVAADTITMEATTGDINMLAPAGQVAWSCVDLNVAVSNNATYKVTEHHSLQTTIHNIDVVNKQTWQVNGQINFTCPTTSVTAQNLQMAVETAQASIQTLAMSGASAEIEGQTVNRTVGTETSTVATHTVTGDRIGIESQGPITINAAASYEVSGVSVVADVQASTTLTGSMVKADGNPGTVAVKGAFVKLN